VVRAAKGSMLTRNLNQKKDLNKSKKDFTNKGFSTITREVQNARNDLPPSNTEESK